MADWHLYMIDCDGGYLYTGITTDVARRFREHARGLSRGAKALKLRRFERFELIYSVPIGDRSLAQRVEYRVKQLTRSEKFSLASSCPSRDALLARLELNKNEEPEGE